MRETRFNLRGFDITILKNMCLHISNNSIGICNLAVSTNNYHFGHIYYFNFEFNFQCIGIALYNMKILD